MGIKYTVLVAISITVSIITIISYRFKYFWSYDIFKTKIEGGTLLYKIYQGNYWYSLPFLNQTRNEISKYLSREEREKAKFFAVCYDNPLEVADMNKCRCVIGIILNQKTDGINNFNVERFIQRHNLYKSTNFASLDAFGAVFPFYNALNLLIDTIRGYLAIKKYGEQNNLIRQVKCSFEIYEYGRQKFTILLPYNGNIDSIMGLTGLPEPISKNKSN